MIQGQTHALAFALPCLLSLVLGCASRQPEASASATRVYKRVDSDGVAHYIIKRGDKNAEADPIPPPRERGADSETSREPLGAEAPFLDRGLPSQIPPPLDRNLPSQIPPPLDRNLPSQMPREALTTEEPASANPIEPAPAYPTPTQTEESAMADSVLGDGEESATADSVLRDGEESATADSDLREDVASAPPQLLLDEIAELERKIAADRELLKMLISEEGVQGGAGLANDERIGEISRRLPALQSELADLRRQAGE